MACDQWQSQLDAYLDGELPADAMRSLDAHYRTCPSCSADALARLQLKRSLKFAGNRYTATPDFRNKIRTKVAARPRRTWGMGWTLATATLALLFAAGAITLYMGRQNLQRQHVYSELADLHVATIGSANPVDVVSSDRHTVKPWFQGKIPFTFNLPELQNTDFTLLGGRVTYLGQTPGAHLIYQIRKHQISVFIFPADMPAPLGSDSGVRQQQTFNAKTWTGDGLRYVVFGDASPADIQSLTNLLKSAAHP